jgi:hypothetical protein
MMKTLTLSIKQKFFDQILAGEKPTETREIRHNNFARYCRYVHCGKEYENIDDVPEDENDIDVVPVKYDAIKLVTGAYKGERPWALVEVTDAEVFEMTDEKDEPITYKVDGETYVAAQIDYRLGKVIERS